MRLIVWRLVLRSTRALPIARRAAIANFVATVGR